MNLWRTWQFPAYGLIAPLIQEMSGEDIVNPTNKIITRKLFIFGTLILTILISEYLIREIWARRKGWDKHHDMNKSSVFERPLSKYRGALKGWGEENLINVNPTFYEEYLFYKCYYKAGKILYKFNQITHIPYELENMVEQSKKDYITSILAGIR
jgi:hypothetical protein